MEMFILKVLHSEKFKMNGEWQYHSDWEYMWFASHLKYIFFTGMGLRFLFSFKRMENLLQQVWNATSISKHDTRFEIVEY